MAAQGWTGAAFSIDSPLLSFQPSVDSLDSMVDGGYQLDTVNTDLAFPLFEGFSIYAGNALIVPALNNIDGYTLSFELQILDEDHTDANRAGFSVLVVSSEISRSLEIAFWEDEVWVYDYVEGAAEDFVKGASAFLDTKTDPVTYTLEVLGDGYILRADGIELFSGALEDYSAREFPIPQDPYETPNSLYFSDNTSRGRSISALYRVELLAGQHSPELILVDGFESTSTSQ